MLKRLPRNLEYLNLDWDIAQDVDDDEEYDDDDEGNKDDNSKDRNDNGDDRDWEDEKNEGARMDGKDREAGEDEEGEDTVGNSGEACLSRNIEWPERYPHLKSIERCPALEEIKMEQVSYGSYETAETLEEPRLGSGVAVSCYDINTILRTCSKLKILSIESKPQDPDVTSRHAFGLSDWYDVQNGVYGTYWVCLQLEDLEITFLDIRNKYYGQDKEKNMVAKIKRIYEQIGRLSKLQRLRLGWHTDQDSYYDANLDMSITSGLEHLEGFKELRELDITCIDQVNVAREEVEWMAENWQKLRRIKSLLKLNDPRFKHEDEIIVTADNSDL
ncbi:hypothetical protein BGX26_003798, partial [Mortierella sp. AD094]